MGLMRGGAFPISLVYIAMFWDSHPGQNKYYYCNLYPFLDEINAVYVLNLSKHQCSFTLLPESNKPVISIKHTFFK